MAKNPDLQRHALNLWKGDYAKLQDLYPEIGAAAVIRQIVHDFIARLEANDTRPASPEIDL